MMRLSGMSSAFFPSASATDEMASRYSTAAFVSAVTVAQELVSCTRIVTSTLPRETLSAIRVRILFSSWLRNGGMFTERSRKREFTDLISTLICVPSATTSLYAYPVIEFISAPSFFTFLFLLVQLFHYFLADLPVVAGAHGHEKVSVRIS